jgi:ribonuclease HI
VFGANTDAYSTKWEGASEANPPHDAEAMEKAVRWAIFSAEKSTSPTLTAFILPKTGANAYQKSLTHPMIRQLGCIEREHISFKTSDHWKTGQPYKHQSREDVTMFVVANQAGLDKFLHMQQLRQQIARASLKHGKKSVILNDIAQLESSDTDIDSELMRGLYEPKTFDQATQAPGLPWGQGYVPSTDEDEEGKIRPQLKRYDPDSMVYTDGSRKEDTNLTGSGVYGWKDGVEEHIRIRPSRSGPVHTINRAELIALLYALCHWHGQSDLVIATDSAYAMQSINEHLQNPEAHRYNKHKNLFRAIIKQLLTRAQRQQNTSIVKVKSHIQIRGNEIADALAVEATKEWDVDMSGDYTEPFGNMVWVTKPVYGENGEVNEAPYLSDLGPALKTAIHRNKRLGQSNQEPYTSEHGVTLRSIWSQALVTGTGKKKAKSQMQC